VVYDDYEKTELAKIFEKPDMLKERKV